MDYPRALSQIAEIHQHLAKGEIYRGYRPLPVAGSGLVGLAAAAAQPASASTNPNTFLNYWTIVAGIACAVGLMEVAYNYMVHDHSHARRHTRQVLSQFLPGVAAAAAVTLGFRHLGPQLIALLPGVWAICFGVGIFASRPYLPRLTGVVALYYLVAGFALIWTTGDAGALNGWRVGATFAAGQLMAAAVLYWELERVPPIDG